MLQISDYYKLQIMVPVTHSKLIREVLGKAGAGEQGDYEYCSGTIQQMGRFRPKPGAHPAIGEVGKLEEVQEEIIQTICHKDRLEQVIAEVKKFHPYEEPAIDIFARYDVK